MSMVESVGEAVPVAGGALKAVAGGIRKILESFDVSDSPLSKSRVCIT